MMERVCTGTSCLDLEYMASMGSSLASLGISLPCGSLKKTAAFSWVALLATVSGQVESMSMRELVDLQGN
jgi:hypothetical protein